MLPCKTVTFVAPGRNHPQKPQNLKTPIPQTPLNSNTVRVLLIDNHDSFTYNLAHLVFQAAGVMPEVVLAEDVTPEHLNNADRIIISPGPGRPEEYPWFPGIFRDPPAPILGVCLGFQGMCMAFGATLERAAHPRHGEVTEGHTRYHSLAITHLPETLEATEWAADGTLMAARHRSLPISGVQYHPESVASSGGLALMREFLAPHLWVQPVSGSPEEFITCFADEENVAWLDSSDGSGWSFLCTGDTVGPIRSSSPLGQVGVITYEGEERFIEVTRAIIVSPTGAAWALGTAPWEPTFTAPPSCAPLPRTPRTFRFGRAAYLDKIKACQEFIARGDSYELCLTNSISFDFPADPLAVYLSLRRAHPSPFAAYLRLSGTEVLSTSPERFLRLVDAHLEAKPIKGTRPRGHSPQKDKELAQDLATSVKDRAENLMICDLLRNDLGRVAVPGSVQVPVLCGVESFATVHQMVSTITAELLPGKTPVDALRAAFPGGSMTGAPKERSMDILAELEGEPRGIYSGAIGYIDAADTMDFSIVIRTIVVKDGVATYGCGGAITRLSDPEKEWQEILVKSRPILNP